MKHKWSILAVMLCIFLSSCAVSDGVGKKETDKILPWEDFAYIPEYVSLDTEGKIANTFFVGDELFLELLVEKGKNKYISQLASVDILSEDRQLVWRSFDFPQSHLGMAYIAADAGNYWILENDRINAFEGAGNVSIPGKCIGKYDREGQLLLRQDITEEIKKHDEDLLIHSMAADGEGNLYIGGEKYIYLYRADGTFKGAVTENEPFHSLVSGRDGKIYYTTLTEKNLKTIDFEEVQGNLVAENHGSGNLFSTETGDMLSYDRNGIYRYDSSKKGPKQVMSWLDIEADGSQMAAVRELEDGRWLALRLESDVSGMRAETAELIYLTVTPVAPEDKRQIITVGTMITWDEVRQAAMDFNRHNDQYRIRVREYVSANTDEGYEEAVSALDLDLVSGNAPDILHIGNVDLQKYVSKGLLEDLNPYLEKSQRLNRDSIIKTVADAYTFDGKLVCIPTSFRLEVIAGRTDKLTGKLLPKNEEMPVDLQSELSVWTPEELYTWIDEYADPAVWNSVSPENMLIFCMKFQQQAWVDWEQGTCSFQTEEFQKMLEFCGQFQGTSIGDGLYQIADESGEKLLYRMWLTSPYRITEIPQFFEEQPVTLINYPVTDGRSGIILDTSLGAYGILADSPHKDAAWTFLENMICDGGDRGISSGFPVEKERLEQCIQEAASDLYTEDKEADSAENKTRRIKTSSIYTNLNTTIHSYALYPENAELLRQLIDNARPVTGNHQAIDRMIQEEASAYFAGQKPVEEVMRLIQNRVELYVSENK